MKRFMSQGWQRLLTFTLLVNMLLPTLLARPASAQIFTHKPAQNQTTRHGWSTGQKLVVLGGAALLYYLWRRHQANAAQNAQATANGATPQLYRSRNGGIYYRDVNGRPVWLTVPNQQVQVPMSDVRRYAPDYRRYRGPAPATPSGERTQPFSEFDNAAFSPGPSTGVLR